MTKEEIAKSKTAGEGEAARKPLQNAGGIMKAAWALSLFVVVGCARYTGEEAVAVICTWYKESKLPYLSTCTHTDSWFGDYLDLGINLTTEQINRDRAYGNNGKNKHFAGCDRIERAKEFSERAIKQGGPNTELFQRTVDAIDVLQDEGYELRLFGKDDDEPLDTCEI